MYKSPSLGRSFSHLLLLLCITTAHHAWAQIQTRVYEPQVVIVQFEEGVLISEGLAMTGSVAFNIKADQYQVHSMTRMYPFLDHLEPTDKISDNLEALRRTYYLRYDEDVIPEHIARDLMKDIDVTYAEPVLMNHADLLIQRDEPNDPDYQQQTYLKHLQLPQVWDVIKSDQSDSPVVIAIVDTGSEWSHEDLLRNVWTNEDEIPNNGVDDDNNGFIDDIHGVNFCNQTGPNSDPGILNEGRGDGFHGTAVAGVASAVSGNGIGIAGAAWNAQLMHIKVVCPNLNRDFHYEGLTYAAMNGADIINNSWGATHIGPVQPSRYISQTLDLATDLGSLIIASAGNVPLDAADYPHYPASYYRVLSVGATERDSREISVSSTYGKTVDVFAPGVSILTTFPNNTYDKSRGTSFSAPLVSGIAALVKSQFPDISPDALREQIRLSSENIDMYNHPRLSNRLGRGFVNALASLQPPTLPGIRIRKWSWSDDDGNHQIDSGDQVDIHIQVANYLTDAESLSLEMIPADRYSFLTFKSKQQSIGKLAGDDSINVVFSFVVADDAPLYQAVKFFPRIYQGAFMDDVGVFHLGINIQLDETVSALRAVYESTSGPRWNNNRNWNFDTFPTSLELLSWYGVLMRNLVVTSINLSYNRLRGKIPAELAQLSKLQSLQLQGNFLEGQIPAELANLSDLNDLNLSENSLSGFIPEQLTQLTRLTSIKLSSNLLVGPIPVDVGRLSQVYTLDLDHNRLSGTIPDELGQMHGLYQLKLSHNQFAGQLPRSLMQLKNLEIFEFDGQDLCAPADEQFQNWLRRITTVRGPTCSGFQLIGVVDDQSFTLGEVIKPLTLPEATGGSSPITYFLKPALPDGLVFDEGLRSIGGQPTIAIDQTGYIYTATDAKLSRDSLSFSIEVVSPVSKQNDGLPQQFRLSGNYPNPFARTTRLRVDLPWIAEVGISILDIAGRTVVTLPSMNLPAGWANEIEISGTDLPAGVYLYRVSVLSPDGHSEYEGRFVRVR